MTTKDENLQMYAEITPLHTEKKISDDDSSDSYPTEILVTNGECAEKPSSNGIRKQVGCF